VNSSPLFLINELFASIPISSSVSKQSETNAGVTTAKFFTPFLAKSSITISVYGFIQGSLPNLDWKETL